MALPMPFKSRSRAERRQRKRILLSNPLVARVGSFGALLLDVSESGARLEHYHRLQTGQATTLRFDWDGRHLTLPCRVVACRVVRFAAGDEGLTVYQSGLSFVDDTGEDRALLKGMTSTFVARALAEQVANAKGVKPVDIDKMPIFREGVLASNEYTTSAASEESGRLIPIKKIVADRGYYCYRFHRIRGWRRTWTNSSEQPDDGFTVSVHEPADQLELLCESYRSADRAGRDLIRTMAAMSVEKEKD